MTRTALITGITGQDGSYLADLLVAQGYAVHGLVRRTSNISTGRIAHLLDGITLHFADLTEQASVERVVKSVKPDEIYNFGAQSYVAFSEICPTYTRATIYNGTTNLLMAASRLPKPPKFYQASSSEMYGNQPPRQHEGTPFAPVSPYAIAKVDAHEMCLKFREQGLPVWCGILFNHESERRGEMFVTRKITCALGRMACGLQDHCALGNLDAKRDWGCAREYVSFVWQMLQTEHPDDYVIATGESHSVREFLEAACREMHSLTGISYLDRFVTDKKLFRKNEVNHLEGDSRKARQALGWEPKVTFAELVKRMVKSDMQLALDELCIRQRRQIAGAA